ncbi:MAG: hypothetical protein N2258_07775 [Brevinematales bacterium]|nr:hypothetical protein [Brevinematales bacterium]
MKKVFLFLLLNNFIFSNQELTFLHQEYLKNPENLIVLKRLAKEYKEQKNFNKAIDFFKLVMEKEPDNPYNHYELALCYKLKGRPDIALQITTNALFYFENNDRLNILKADILLDMGRVKLALDIYNNYKETCESDKKAYIYGKIARCYLELKDYKNAENYFIESLKLKANSWNYYYLSKLYEENKNYEHSLWAIKKALAYSTKDKIEAEVFNKRLNYLLYQKGIELKEGGQIEKAKEIFVELINRNRLKNCIYVEKANYWVKRL